MLGCLVSVNRETAEITVRPLSWTVDDPSREGQFDTPARVVRSYEEFFAAYLDDPAQILSWRGAHGCA